MPRPRVTEEDKEAVKTLLLSLYERSGADSWPEFARITGLGEFSLADWRNKRSTPAAGNFIQLLQASGELPGDLSRLREDDWKKPRAESHPKDAQSSLLARLTELAGEMQGLDPGFQAAVEQLLAVSEQLQAAIEQLLAVGASLDEATPAPPQRRRKRKPR